jgi:hypothetical protein
MKTLATPTDVEKTFLELLGFDNPDGWTEFCKKNPDESRMMASHFNIAMKVAVAKCQEILAWRKLDVKKYNIPKKRPFKSILDTKEDPQIITKLEFVPKKSPTESISTVSTTTPPQKTETRNIVYTTPACNTDPFKATIHPTPKAEQKAFILEQKSTQTYTWPYSNNNWYKEKHDMLNSIKRLENEKNQLSNLSIKYYNLLQTSNRKIEVIHKRFYDCNETLVKIINDLSTISTKINV